MANYFDDFEGKAGGSSLFVPLGRMVRLPDQPCRFVMLSHFNVLNNAAYSFRTVSGDSLYENAGEEIYYGFHGILTGQLFPSQNTGLLPVSNLNQICLQGRPGVEATIWYSWFS